MSDPACSDPACAYRVEVERRTLEAEASATELRDALAAIAYSSVRRDAGVQMRDIALAALEEDEKKGKGLNDG